MSANDYYNAGKPQEQGGYYPPPQGGPPGGGYYPQQPQQSYQGGYNGPPQGYPQQGYPQQGYQPQPGPQTIYVYVIVTLNTFEVADLRIVSNNLRRARDQEDAWPA
ncbi:hypothetical protein JR316_0008252 [Psilocybe cubensis]|uniref:Uncharacterized protein n=1 Tax=Psilocybe cubensis TaxID=181762 RepID=A0ACB8GW43_PSICU|nr:hypothetical protein JR316_0008252 [Psilocybe cubensis]KAH9479657.1 hypothetical protein JR316_0008252 [Psilocybe cubensis]